jgi:hypothetical protein
VVGDSSLLLDIQGFFRLLVVGLLLVGWLIGC